MAIQDREETKSDKWVMESREIEDKEWEKAPKVIFFR